jgi:hypothetical protein
VTVNYKDVRQQINRFGENAPLRKKELATRRDQALALLTSYANETAALQQKVQEVLHLNVGLRCAIPEQAPLTLHCSTPLLQHPVTLIAADGSQINFDRHAEAHYALINLGAIITRSDSNEAPKTTAQSEMFFGDQLYTPNGLINESDLASARDLGERAFVAKLAETCLAPTISLTDGPLELWSDKASNIGETTEYQNRLLQYQDLLDQLRRLQVTPAGFVDVPSANLVVRMLELTLASPAELSAIKNFSPLHGVRDIDLFKDILQPGDRSAVFAIQSLSTRHYKEDNRIKFFYLNIGTPKFPWLARVEIPAWVAQNSVALDNLHATLINQCRILENYAYPYLLHRAHEIAKVSIQEKEQVDHMVSLELRKRGVLVEGPSHKQYLKNSPGRARYKR